MASDCRCAVAVPSALAPIPITYVQTAAWATDSDKNFTQDFNAVAVRGFYTTFALLTARVIRITQKLYVTFMRKLNGGQPWGLNFLILQGDFGANIRLLREKRELSQKQLAAAAQVTQAEISNIERAVANPSLEVATKIATALEVPFSRLFQSQISPGSERH